MSAEDINKYDLPDISQLQQLANEFFKAMPNQLAGDGGQSFIDHGIIKSTFDENLTAHKNKDSGRVKSGDDFPGARNLPSSVAGSGVSPSAINHSKSFNIADPQTSLPDPHFNDGKIPSSVAGKGITPSAEKHPHKFNPNEPPTILPDPHFAGEGKIPKSIAGSGVSPSFARHSGIDGRYSSYLEQNANPQQPALKPSSFDDISKHSYGAGHLPYQSQLPFEKELNEVLSHIKPSLPSAQLPGINSIFDEPSFYFLSAGNYFSGPEGTIPFPGHAHTEQKQLPVQPKMAFDINAIRSDFPVLNERVNGRQLIWLDNAATTQKPRQVIDRVSYYYEHENSNIHRAAHELAARATDAYELARKKVQAFLNASSPNEIVFVRGATEAINLVAKSWGEQNLKEGDEIIITHLEHHANIVPWQQLSAKKGTNIKVIPVDDDGQILLDEYAKLLGPKTKLVSFPHVSNALGTITPAKKIVEMAHHIGAKVLVDGAQSVSHLRTDVTYLDCDWYVFSGHKVFGPTGVGVLYGKEELLNESEPWQGGGNMIKDVTFEKTTYQNSPGRFEAGTGNIADAVGLGAAIDYVSRIGIDLISQYEHYLLLYATKLLKDIPGLRLIGTAADKAGVISFVLDGYKTEEVGTALNQYGVAVRSGHHCAQPILRRFGVEATVRPSLALYNTCSDVETLAYVVQQLSRKRATHLKK